MTLRRRPGPRMAIPAAVGHLRGRVLSTADRRPTVAVGIAVVRRDTEVGGLLMAGALAFRLFIWLLPLCLLVTAVLGFTATSSHSAEELGRNAGMSPLTVSVLGQVGDQAQHGRYLSAVLGVVLMAWAGIALARVLDRIHDRVWLDRQADRHPKRVLIRATRYNAALIAMITVNVAGPVVATATGLPTVLIAIPALVINVAIVAMLLSVGWPPAWRQVLPGAILVAFGIEGLHLVAVLYLPGKLARASQLYGALGIAAALLVWLALIARLFVFGQVLNVVLAERGQVSAEPRALKGSR